MGMKWFSSEMAGAPVLNDTAGSLINVLDACLITGFGAKQVQSGTAANGQAVLTVDNTNGYKVESTLLIEGVTGVCAALNGERRIVAVTANTITVKAAGVANGTLDGTVSLKYAPAGWTKPFTDTNVAVYKQGDITATGMLLRVNDQSGMRFDWCAYESMSDANTGTGETPVGGTQGRKLGSSSSTSWMLFATDTFVYLFNKSAEWWGSNFGSGFFGDLNEARSDDISACLITAHGSIQSLARSGYDIGISHSGGACWLPRAISQIVGVVTATKIGVLNRNGIPRASGANYDRGTWPSGDSALRLCAVEIYDQNGVLRGVLPRLFHIAQTIAQGTLARGEIIAGTGDLAGRKLMAVWCYISDEQAATIFLDITE